MPNLTVSGNEITDAVRTANVQGDGRAATWALTLSGNEITDVIRTANIQGDGRSPESSMGIWETTNNQVQNGGFETNINFWGANNGNITISRDTSVAKFGSASLKVTTNGAAGLNGSGARYSSVVVIAGEVWTLSAWVKDGSTSGMQVQVRIEWRDVSLTPISTTVGTATALTGSWQRLVVTGTAPAGAVTARLRIDDPDAFNWPAVNGAFFSLDGVQMEKKPYATPYVETDGINIIRGTAHVQAPSNLFANPSQGWVAVRMRVGFPSTNVPNNSAEIFGWATDGSNYYQLRIVTPTARLQMYRVVGGALVDAAEINLSTFNEGDIVTCVGAWTSTAIKASYNGSVFTSFSGSHVPVINSGTFDIGSNGQTVQNHINSDMFWFACGIGTLTDADAATLNAFGNTDPTLLTLPGQPTMLWTGVNGVVTPNQESSFGIWEGTTNLIPNGGFETNTTGAIGTDSTLSRVTTSFKFGTASLQVVTA